MKVEETKKEKVELIKPKLKINAALKQFSFWIPLYADSDTSQVLSLSFQSNFSMQSNDL